MPTRITTVILIVFICLLFINFAYPQNSKIDSLENVLKRPMPDTSKAKVLSSLGYDYFNKDVEKSILYGKKLLTLSQKMDDQKHIAQAYDILSRCYIVKSYDIDTIIQVCDRGIKAAEKAGVTALRIGLIYAKGITYEKKGFLEKALSFYQKVFELAKEKGETRRVITALYGMSSVMARMENDDLAKAYIIQAVKYAEELGDEYLITYMKSGLGDQYYVEQNYDSTIIIMKSVLEYCERNGDKYAKAVSLANIGKSYLKKNQIDLSLEYLKKGYEVALEINNDNAITLALMHISENYLIQKNYTEAAKKAKEGLKILGKEGNIHRKKAFYAHLLNSYKSQEQLDSAFQYQQLYYELQDSIFNLEKDKQINSLTIKYEVEQKEAENELLKSQKIQDKLAIRQSIIIGVGTVLILLIVVGFLRHSNQQRKQQNELLEQKVEERTKELLTANEELNEIRSIKLLEEAKSRFFANISHEFRTPLTLIQAPLELVLKSNELSNRNYTMLTRALQNSKQLLRLVGQILDLTKLEANELALKETKVLFYPFMRKTIANFESYAQQKKIDLKFEYHLNKDIQLEIDEDKVEKILNNYLSNAIKFTSTNGKITIIVSNTGNNIKIAVQDNGKGIPKEELQNVFKRYYQVRNGQTDAPLGQMNYHDGGTGIGLSLCADYAALMNAKVWVESQNKDRKGSTFFFEFPQKEFFAALSTEELETIENEPIVSSLPFAENQGQKSLNPTLLIVEDSYDLQGFLTDLLTEDYNIITKENGQTALDWLGETDTLPNLIISDVMMPKMDGFEFLENLKNSDEYRHIPVLMLTARAEMKDKLKALRIGVDDYLLKPFNDVELKVRIKNLIEKTVHRFVKIASEKGEDEAKAMPMPKMSFEDSQWLQELEMLIEKNIADFNLTADVIVDKMYISRSKLFRKLKHLTGLTFSQYLKEARLQKAKSILESGQFDTIKSISYSIGIKQPAYFSKNYKQRFGKRPSEYL